MASEPSSSVSQPDVEEKGSPLRLQRYSLAVTGALILAGCAIVTLTIWGTGVNVTRLVRLPEIFNPVNDVCLRFGWHDVKGTPDPVRLCNEWIRLSDPSGEPHRLLQETHVVQGADGKLYFDHGPRMGYQAFGLMAWVITVIAVGTTVKRRLVARYRLKLGVADKAC